MSKSRLIAIVVLGLAGGLVACTGTDSVTSGSTDALTENVAALALQTDTISEEVVQMELASMALPSGTGGGTITDQRSFTRTRPCPAGGEMSVSGEIMRTYDPATRELEAEFSSGRTRTDCAFTVPDAVITINGSSSSDHFRRRVSGVPDGPQTSHYMGSWHAVSSTGEERMCSFDYTVVRNPDTMTRTVDGTACGNVLHHNTVWNPN